MHAQFSGLDGLGNVYAGLVVELVGSQYRKLALGLTKWENHRLASDFKQAANLKVFVFMVFNCYFSVVWLAFFDANEAGLPPQQHLSNVGSMAATMLCTRAGAFLVGSVVLQPGQSGRLGGATAGHHGLLRLHLKA